MQYAVSRPSLATTSIGLDRVNKNEYKGIRARAIELRAYTVAIYRKVDKEQTKNKQSLLNLNSTNE